MKQKKPTRSWVPTAVVLLIAALSGSLAGPALGKELNPLPPEDARKEADLTIKDLFRDEFKNRSPEVQNALAAKLLKQGTETKDDLAVSYQLLFIAQSLASQQGNVKLAFDGIAELQRLFAVNSVDLQMKALANVQRKAKRKEDFVGLAKAYLSTASQALEKEQFTEATSACRSALRYARMGQDIKLYTRAQKEEKALRETKGAFLKIAAARKKLTANPDDPQANLKIGKFYFVERKNWTKGLA